MVSVAAIITGGFAVVVGLALAILGWAAIEGGRGGYGYGPFPMIPVPRDNTLIGVGVVMVLVGATLVWAGLSVAGVWYA